MKLGIHNYSYYMHGLGGRWMGFEPPWPNPMDVFGLQEKTAQLGLDGVHLDMAAIGSTDPDHLEKVGKDARDKGLFMEFNWGLPKPGADPRLQFALSSGIEICRRLGADLGKLSLNLTRPRPVMGSRHAPEIMDQLSSIKKQIIEILPLLDQTGIRLALENHTDAYASEVIWLIEAVGHPLVGACVDTVNPMMVGEDPMQAIEALTPYAFTNHFRDSIIDQTPYGCRIVGCALGDGDLDLKRAYELLKTAPHLDRLNIEIALDAPADQMKTALDMENKAVEKSIDFCRNHLGISTNMEDE